MKCAIFTSLVEQDFFSLVQQSFIDYSKKCNADLIIRQSQHVENYNTGLKATCERYDIYNLLNIYDRVLWLDSDIYITKNAPNIFDVVPSNKLGMFCEDNDTEKKDAISVMAETMRLASPVINYFNSGVILASKQHSGLFNIDKLNEFFKQSHIKVSRNSDQDYINLLIETNKIDTFKLPSEYNYMIKHRMKNKDFKPHFIHFAGCYPKKIYIQQFLKGNPNL